MAGIFDFLMPQQGQQTGFDAQSLLPMLAFMEQQKQNQNIARQASAADMGAAAKGSYGAAMYPILAGAGGESKIYAELQQEQQENFLKMEQMREAQAIKQAQNVTNILKAVELKQYREDKIAEQTQHEREWEAFQKQGLEEKIQRDNDLAYSRQQDRALRDQISQRTTDSREGSAAYQGKSGAAKDPEAMKKFEEDYPELLGRWEEEMKPPPTPGGWFGLGKEIEQKAPPFPWSKGQVYQFVKDHGYMPTVDDMKGSRSSTTTTNAPVSVAAASAISDPGLKDTIIENAMSEMGVDRATAEALYEHRRAVAE